MAGPTLKALSALPWGTILKQAPAILAVAKGLQAGMGKGPPPLRPDADLPALRQRIGELESVQQEHARVLSQLAEHVSGLPAAIEAARQQGQRAMLTGAAGLGVGLVALLLAWLL